MVESLWASAASSRNPGASFVDCPTLRFNAISIAQSSAENIDCQPHGFVHGVAASDNFPPLWE
jgi:hypothetical protein